MRKLLLFTFSIAILGLNAQQVALTKVQPTVETSEDVMPYKQGRSQAQQAKTNTVVWSEDFAGGIPSNWTNVCYNLNGGAVMPNGYWEFRGPSTNPSNATGSRGGFAGSGTPLQSPTASNGFIIFDSNYLDDAGTQNRGTGVAPAPHRGVLITDTLDLTGYPFIELKFNASVRRLDSYFRLGISRDGGVTYPDTIDLYPGLAANTTIPRNAEYTVNISSEAGNQSMVRLAFIFDGEARGYYYWMMDDIEIRNLSRHEFRFTESGGAPAHDIIYSGSSANFPKQGHIPLNQIVPIHFDSNVLNYGSQPQTNVTFSVEIYNSSGSLVNTLSSSTVPVINSGDTIDYNTFFTPQWTPTNADDYTFVYTVTSDSIPAAIAPRDSFSLFVTAENPAYSNGERASLDNNSFDNNIGTNNLGNDGSGMGVQLDFRNGDNGTSNVLIWGFELGYSSTTVDGGDIIFEVYDTTGFSYTGGFGGSSLISRQFNVATGSSGTVQYYDLTNGGVDPPLSLPADRYYFVVSFFSNGGANEIRLANDQSFESPDPRHSIMYNTTDTRWYSGYSNSRSFNHPWIRVYSENVLGIGIEEPFHQSLSLYPNPAREKVEYTLTEGGKYSLELRALNGQLLVQEEVISNGNQKHSLDIAQLPKGVYLVKVFNENSAYTNKLIIE